MGARYGQVVQRLVNRVARRQLLVLVLLISLLFPVGASAAPVPGNVKVFANPPGQVCISWSAVEGANQYKIYDVSGIFLAVSGQANVPKCLPEQVGNCFMVSAMTNSGETDKSAAVCGNGTAQTSSAPAQQILTAATTSASDCLPYSDSVFVIPYQPLIFCGQATQSYVVCDHSGRGGNPVHSIFTDTTFDGSDSQRNGNGGRECDPVSEALGFQLPLIDYSSVASHDYPSLEEIALSYPALQGLDPQTIDKVLASVGCVAHVVGYIPPAAIPAKIIDATVSIARAKTNDDIGQILAGQIYDTASDVTGIHNIPLESIQLVQACGATVSELQRQLDAISSCAQSNYCRDWLLHRLFAF